MSEGPEKKEKTRKQEGLVPGSLAAQALEPTLVLQSLVATQGPAELESSSSGDYTGAAEPSGGAKVFWDQAADC